MVYRVTCSLLRLYLSPFTLDFNSVCTTLCYPSCMLVLFGCGSGQVVILLSNCIWKGNCLWTLDLASSTNILTKFVYAYRNVIDCNVNCDCVPLEIVSKCCDISGLWYAEKLWNLMKQFFCFALIRWCKFIYNLSAKK